MHAHLTINDFQPGDLLEIVTRTKRGDETRAAEVTAVNFNNLGGVTFMGDYRDGMQPAGQGWFDPAKVGTTTFGYVAVRKVGHRRPWTPCSPRPGDRAYDLMC